jgi:hypothetical protein
VAGITPSQFRLGPDTLADLDALAANNGGRRTTALKEATAQFRAAIEEAARANADALSPEEWALLGDLNQPDPYADMPDDVRDDVARWGVDWSAYLAAELVGAWESRAVVLPLHQEQAAAARALARKVGRFGRVRGYALMAALRWWWTPGTERTIEQCADPAAWMTPADRAEK